MSGGDVGPATVAMRCYVSGFSEALDWRPLVFEEPVVRLRLCALCGVLSRRAVRLPCTHLLCSDCHLSCARQGNCCPLDQSSFCEDDLDWLEVPVGFLERREVACWNEPNGCNFAGLATRLLDHYRVCTFHAVSCPQCHSRVLRDHIVEHCRQGCDAQNTTCTTRDSSALHYRNTVDESCLAALDKITEDLSALKASLDEHRKDTSVANARTEQQGDDRASKLAEKLDSLSAVCSEERKTLHKAMDSSREKISSLLRTQADKLVESMEELSKSVLRLSESRAAHWYLHNWAEMKEKALNRGLVSVSGPMRHVFRYKLSHFVQLERVGEQLRFGCFLELHPGRCDSELEWPFGKTFSFGVVHPKHRSVLSYKMHASEHKDQACLQRPHEERSSGLGTRFLCTAEKLEADGFVDNDTLHLILRVEP